MVLNVNWKDILFWAWEQRGKCWQKLWQIWNAIEGADVVLSQGIKVPKWNVLTFVVKIHQMLFYQIIWQWYFTWASQPWKGFFISHKFQHMITHTGKTFQKKTCCFLHSLNWFIRDSCIYSYLLDIQWTSQRQGRGERNRKARHRETEGEKDYVL